MLFTLMRIPMHFFIFKIQLHIRRKEKVASWRKAFSFMNVLDTFSLETNVSFETNYYIAFPNKDVLESKHAYYECASKRKQPQTKISTWATGERSTL